MARAKCHGKDKLSMRCGKHTHASSYYIWLGVGLGVDQTKCLGQDIHICVFVLQ
jgi:hypothetical protein